MGEEVKMRREREAIYIGEDPRGVGVLCKIVSEHEVGSQTHVMIDIGGKAKIVNKSELKKIPR